MFGARFLGRSKRTLCNQRLGTLRRFFRDVLRRCLAAAMDPATRYTPIGIIAQAGAYLGEGHCAMPTPF